jgi:hypothetical protein
MDGYWLLSDVLAVSNLMTANRETTAWLVRATLGKNAVRPEVLRLPRVRKAIYLAYYFGFVAFTVYLMSRFYVWYLPYLSSSYPHLIRSTLKLVRVAPLSLQSLKALVHLLTATIPLLGPALYFQGYLGKAIRHVRASLAGAGFLTGQISL